MVVQCTLYEIYHLELRNFVAIECVKVLNNRHHYLVPERFLPLGEKALARSPPSCSALAPGNRSFPFSFCGFA